MNSISELHDHAQLAQAAYSNLRVGSIVAAQLLTKGSDVDAPNMALTQAQAVAERYEVLRTFSDDAGRSGAYAVLFRIKGTDQVTLAVRGTQGLLDWYAANSLLMLGIPPALNPQFRALSGAVQEWIAEGLIPAGSSVVGHSLGGYLAAGLKAGFPQTFTSAITVNAPGFVQQLGPAPNVLQTLFGMPIAQDGVLDLRGTAGLSVIADLGNHLGQLIPIEIEAATAPFVGNHSADNIARSLAVLDLWATLDPSMDLTRGNGLLASASATSSSTHEVAVETVQRLVHGPDHAALPRGDADALYAAINSLKGLDANRRPLNPTFASLAGHVTLRPVSGQLVTQAVARVDFQTFVALQTLAPFVVDPVGPTGEGALQSLWRSTGWMALHDQWREDAAAIAAGRDPTHFTNQWLADRAAFIVATVEQNRTDNGERTIQPGQPGAQATLTLDVATGRTVLVGEALPSQRQQIEFGRDIRDELEGGAMADRLYGGGGDDTLDGLGGADHLEGHAGSDLLLGGAGDDTLLGGVDHDTLDGGTGRDRLNGGLGDDRYRFRLGDGQDTIRDADGLGSIFVDGIGTLNGRDVEAVAPGAWRSLDGRVTYTLAPTDGRTDLLVTYGPSGDSIVIEDWGPGRTLGLDLPGAPVPRPVDRRFDGDFDKARNAEGTGYLVDAEGRYLSAGPSAPAHDVINGTVFADELLGGAGDDGLSGGEGDDRLVGGDGRDLLLGGTGADWIDGGDGNDLIFGSALGGIATPGAVGAALPEVPPGDEVVAQGFSWVAHRRPLPPDANPSDRYFRGVNVVGANLYKAWTGDDGLTRVEGSGNVIHAGAGDDHVEAGTGDDVAHGGDGRDTLIGLRGHDRLYGDGGDDLIAGDGFSDRGTLWFTAPRDHGHDLLFGGDGDDTLVGQGGDDWLWGGTGRDRLSGDGFGDELPHEISGHDHLDGGADDDVLVGGRHDDVLIGGDGDDLLFGDVQPHEVLPAALHGNDRLDGGAGRDDLIGGGGDDVLLGGDGDDLLLGDDDAAVVVASPQGDDRLEGGHGRDTLGGGGGHDVLLAGDGDDLLYGDEIGQGLSPEMHGHDLLDGGAGHDVLVGDGGNDWLIGGTGADAVEGGAGDDTFVVRAGDLGRDAAGRVEGVSDESGHDRLIFEGLSADDLTRVDVVGARDLVLHFRDGGALGIREGALGSIERFEFGGAPAVDAWTLMARHADTVTTLPVRVEGREVVIGGRGNDNVPSWSAGAVLIGGRGDDVLLGHASDHRYHHGRGDGHDLIRDEINTPFGAVKAATSRIVFGAGIRPEDLSLRIDGTRLVLLVAPTAEHPEASSVAIDGFDVQRLGDSLSVRTLEFADGQTMAIEALWPRGTVVAGRAGAEVAFGTPYADRFEASTGDDLLVGGAGADRYRAGRGLGSDAIDDRGRAGDVDVLELSGVDPAEVEVRRSRGGDLLLRWGSGPSAETVALIGQRGGAGLEQVRFDDGTVWGRADLDARAAEPQATAVTGLHQGSAADEWLVGGDGDDQIDAGAGNDLVLGGAGRDTLHAGPGQDRLDGGAGDDELRAMDEGDVLLGGGGDDTLVAAEATQTLLVGGPGRDQLLVQGQAPVIRFDRGDGVDTVVDYDGRSRLVFGPGITPQDVRVDRLPVAWAESRSSVRLQIDGGTDAVILEAAIEMERLRTPTVHFTDGTVWTADDLLQRLNPSPGTPGNDRLLGTPHDDVIAGGDGHDMISGLAGDDRLDGGPGRDLLNGGDGDDELVGGPGEDLLSGQGGRDVYLLGPGHGNDQLWDGVYRNGTTNAAGDADTLRYVGVTADQVIASRGNWHRGDLILSLRDGSGCLTVHGWFAQDRADTLIVEFSDGTRWSSADLHAMTAVAASPGRDWLYGTPGVDMLAAGAGDDVISAGAGDDRIDGGPGDDRLDGGSGSDVFVFGRGAGRDEIVLTEERRPGEVDTIAVAPDLRPVDLELLHEASRTVLRIRGTTDEIAWGRYVGDVPVESIRFADGTVWSPWPSSPAVQTGTEAADRLTGGGLDDLLDGLGGADVLVAGAGHDVLRGGAGDDELSAGDDAHRDRLEGGPGDDRLWVRPSDVVVFGRGDGRDTVYAMGGVTLELGPGIAPADVRLRAGRDGALVVSLRDAADDISLIGYFWNAEVRRGTVLSFADGVRWDAEAVLARLDRIGTPEADVLIGSAAADALSGGDGDDEVRAAGGDDQLRGDSGQDLLVGDEGDDDLRGGPGMDRLVGGSGRDTFHFERGDGRDAIPDFGDGSIVTGRPGDRLRFGDGIRPEDIRLSMNQYHELLLQVGSTGDSVNLGLWFSANHVDSTATIEFADGTVWQRSDVAQRWHLEQRAASWSGSPGHDSMVGHDGHETLRGLGGDDHLVGHAGDDMLVGGDGHDRLEGGADTDALHGGFGDDTYVFRRGDGRDRIVDIDLVGGRDRLVFGPGIDAGDLLVQTQAHELTLALRGTDDAVTIAWDPALGLEVEELHFADGSTWRTADLVAAVSASADLVGTVGDDLLAGNALANRLAGGAGRDTLDGGDGQDELVGGTGRDLLRGGRGGDLYRIGAADGSDVIAEVPDRPGEHDVLAFSPGIRPDQLWFRREGEALEVRQLATGERTLIEGWYAPGGGRIEEFRTDSGHALMERQVQALVEAMAGFAPPPPGSSALPSPTAALLAPVIGAHWSAPGG